MRSGIVTDSSWASMPPKLVPITRKCVHSRWSARATTSLATSAMVYGLPGRPVRPNPLWSAAATSKCSTRGVMKGADPARVAPDPFKNISFGPDPDRS